MKRLTGLAMGAVLVAAVACGSYAAPSSYNNNNGGGGGGGPAPNSVDVLDNRFSPDSLNVAAGTTITWTWGGYAIHNVTFSDRNLGDSGDQMAGTFLKTFDSTGVFEYHCTHHAGMVGKIVVH